MMDALTLSVLLAACAPQVHPETASALIAVESARNQYAIGVVGGALVRQPANRQEAIATARALQDDGWNFSVGLGQINLRNFARLGLTTESAFDPCTNLGAMQTVLSECFDRAGVVARTGAARLRDALSCYYSGGFSSGYRQAYVRKVVMAAVTTSALPNRKERS
jgi:type IV secretion system protein VirB1